MSSQDRGDATTPSTAAAVLEFIGSQLFAPMPEGVDRELLALRSEDGAWHSATLCRRRGHKPRTGIVLMHPATSFMQHYALGVFAQMGFAAMGVAARFAAESDVILELCLLDLASAVAHLREIGCEHVALLGNSGGGGLMSFYQAEAEQPTVTATPAGDPPNLTESNLPAGDAVVFLNAHQGRAQVITSYLDPAVIDEADPVATDPALDMFDPANGPPYSADFVQRYRQAQVARNNRITSWALTRLEELGRLGIRDQAFVVHRTTAALEFLDLTLSPSDRPLGWYGGPDVQFQNRMASSLARFNTLRSWVSSFGLATTNGLSGPNLKRVSVPLLIVQGTADEGIFPPDAQANYDAAGSIDKELYWVKGGNHFFTGQAELQRDALQKIADWLSERGFGPDGA